MPGNGKQLEQLEEWTSTIATKLPNLSKPQAVVLALWSFGMVLARSCGLTSVVTILAPLLSIKKDKDTVRRKENEGVLYSASGSRSNRLVISPGEIGSGGRLSIITGILLND